MEANKQLLASLLKTSNDGLVGIQQFLNRIKFQNLAHNVADLAKSSTIFQSIRSIHGIFELYDFKICDDQLTDVVVKNLTALLIAGINKIRLAIKSDGHPLVSKQAFDVNYIDAGTLGILGTVCIALLALGCGAWVLTTSTKLNHLATSDALSLFSNISRSVTSFGKLKEQIVDLFKVVTDQLGITVVDMMNGTETALMNDITDLVQEIEGANTILPKNSAIYLRDTKHYSDLVTQAVAIEKRAHVEDFIKRHSTLSALCTRLGTAREKLRGIIIQIEKSITRKQEPAVVYLYGKPGVGKTEEITTIVDELSRLEGKRLTVWYRPPNVDHDDGYVGQDVVVLDDLGQMNEDSDVSFLMSAKSSSTFFLRKAAIEEKGQVFTSRYIIVTSNFFTIRESRVVKSMEALARRRDIVIEVTDPRYRSGMPSSEYMKYRVKGWHPTMRQVNMEATYRNGRFDVNANPVLGNNITSAHIADRLVTFEEGFARTYREKTQADQIENLSKMTDQDYTEEHADKIIHESRDMRPVAGDGHCLFHSVGAVLNISTQAIVNQMINVVEKHKAYQFLKYNLDDVLDRPVILRFLRQRLVPQDHHFPYILETLAREFNIRILVRRDSEEPVDVIKFGEKGKKVVPIRLSGGHYTPLRLRGGGPDKQSHNFIKTSTHSRLPVLAFIGDPETGKTHAAEYLGARFIEPDEFKVCDISMNDVFCINDITFSYERFCKTMPILQQIYDRSLIATPIITGNTKEYHSMLSRYCAENDMTESKITRRLNVFKFSRRFTFFKSKPITNHENEVVITNNGVKMKLSEFRLFVQSKTNNTIRETQFSELPKGDFFGKPQYEFKCNASFSEVTGTSSPLELFNLGWNITPPLQGTAHLFMLEKLYHICGDLFTGNTLLSAEEAMVRLNNMRKKISIPHCHLILDDVTFGAATLTDDGSLFMWKLDEGSYRLNESGEWVFVRDGEEKVVDHATAEFLSRCGLAKCEVSLSNDLREKLVEVCPDSLKDILTDDVLDIVADITSVVINLASLATKIAFAGSYFSEPDEEPIREAATYAPEVMRTGQRTQLEPRSAFDEFMAPVYEAAWHDDVDDGHYSPPDEYGFDYLKKGRLPQTGSTECQYVWVYDEEKHKWVMVKLESSKLPDNPKKLKRTNQPAKESVSDQSFWDTVEKIRKNVVTITSDNGRCQGYAVCRGLVITVAHVAKSDTSSLTVRGSDEREYSARIVRRDTKRDLMVVRLPQSAPAYPDILNHLVTREMSVKPKNEKAVILFQRGAGQYAVSINLDEIRNVTFTDGTSVSQAVPYFCSTIARGQNLSVEGDCGAPVILNNSKYQKKVFGLHIGATDNQGYMLCVTSDTFLSLASLPKKQSGDTSFIEYLPSKITHPDKGLHIIGRTLDGKGKYFNRKGSIATTIAPSPLCPNPTIYTKYQPSILTKMDPRADKDPFELAVNNLGNRPPVGFDKRDLVMKCARDIAAHYISAIKEKFPNGPIQRLDQGAVINGVAYLPNSHAIDRSTSAGFPFVTLDGVSGKSTFFEQGANINGNPCWKIADNRFGRFLKENLQWLESGYRNGEKRDVIFQAIPKDEVLPSGKICRFIYAAPLGYVMKYREYNMTIDACIIAVRDMLPIKIGMDPHSEEWNQMVATAISKSGSSEGICADYSGFDRKFWPIIKEAVGEIYCLIAKHCGDEHYLANNVVRRRMFEALLAPKISYGGVVLEVEGLEPSGFPSTTEWNSLANLIYLLCFYHERSGLDKPSFKSLIEMLSPVVYGDDFNLFVPNSLRHTITFKTLKEYMETVWGFKITPGFDKKADGGTLHTLDQMVFLQRGFHFDGTKYTAPLLPGVFAKMLAFTRTPKRRRFHKDFFDKVQFDTDNLIASVRNLEVEIELLAPDVQQQMKSFINERLEQYKVPYAII